MEKITVDILLRYRYWWALLSIMATVLLAAGSKNLYMETDYKIYFNDDDPQLVAHETMQATYTKTDSLGILIKPADGDIFTARNLQIVRELTDKAWQAPYSIRVDSLSNFQYSKAEGDDLLISDLVSVPTEQLDSKEIARIRAIALSEKQLLNRIISRDGSTTIVVITLELPREVDPEADAKTQTEQRILRDGSFPKVVNYGQQLADELQAQYPDLAIHLVGPPVINNSFAQSSQDDMALLIPAMYSFILLLLLIFLRSLGSVVGTILLIGSATIAAIGAAGWLGFSLNTINVIAPTIILTISVCDAVHLLMVYLRNLSLQLPPVEAMRESLRLNLQPIVLTSITTAVGFFTLNFSVSPPFRQFGTISGIGVLWALLLTFTLLPTLTILLVRKRKKQANEDLVFSRLAKFIVAKRKPIMILTSIVAVGLIALIPLNKVDDDPANYFKPGTPYRDATDFQIENLPSVKDINFSIRCGKPGCISDPAFLNKLAAFGDWLEAQPDVEYVATYIDVIKRLNKNMNADNQAFYRLPDNAELSAQYNLLYEMSLPYGLDLNNQINFDKSATRISVFTNQVTTGEFIALEERARQWLSNNHAELETSGSSIYLMFSHIGENNIRSMLIGSIIAIIGVTLTILIALRSFRYALISMIPNMIPALMAFGVWAVLVGQVNMAIASVFSIALGILVDDTVHFISKYRRAREHKGLSTEQAIEYAFTHVGSALVVTTVVLVMGFALLSFSSFNLNSMMGKLTAMTIAIALIFDFLILPPILMLIDKDKQENIA